MTTDSDTENSDKDRPDPTEIGSHGYNWKEEKGITVFKDSYECPDCQNQFSVTDFSHRTHVGYDTPTVRCGRCDVGMVRIE